MSKLSTIGELTFARTYSRTKPDGTQESFEDVIERVLDSAQRQLGCGFSHAQLNRLRKYMTDLKGIVAGRFLWQMGTSTVDRIGLASLQNCAFVTVDEPIRPFTWTMDMLSLGAGVGYNLQREHVDKLPPVSDSYKVPTHVDDKGADFIVPDSREGWVKLLGKTLKAAFYGGTFTYSTCVVRSKGTPIKGFGGVASGPEVLIDGIQKIATVLYSRKGQKLRPIDVLDVMNIIGSIIVAGNVRRSAQIAIGDADDIEFLKAKTWTSSTPVWRAMSNNSVVCDDVSKLPEVFWDSYCDGGEPYGLINLKMAQREGRTGETQYPDHGVKGFNPCAEQGLADHETCCLAEVFLPNIDSYEELCDVIQLLYRLCKHSLMLDTHHPETAAIVRKNMRMGIGITGYLQADDIKRGWLAGAYEQLREYDVTYSSYIGTPTSVKLTTVKPSGTLSLLPGVTPGCHPAYSRWMIRRIRIAAGNPLIKLCEDNGYPVEAQRNWDGSIDHTTFVVSFPFSYPEGTVVAAEMTAIKQLEVVRRLQREWSDNSVSCTVYFRKEELPGIREYLEKYYSDNFKSLSFLLHSEHGFDQAPLEEISQEVFEEMSRKCKPIRMASAVQFESDDECAKGACPIR